MMLLKLYQGNVRLSILMVIFCSFFVFDIVKYLSFQPNYGDFHSQTEKEC